MRALAVTGGIGSGKTAVVEMLARKPGVRVASADEEARRLMVEDDALRAALVNRFGADTYREDGSLDREGLAARVFGDPAEVEALNSIVHPAVLRALKASIEQARDDGVELFVYEAALLVEIGVGDVVDAVVLVDAPLEKRLERVMARNNVSREAVLDRARHQVPPETLRAHADYVIDNTGDLSDLQEDVDALYAAVLHGAGA